MIIHNVFFWLNSSEPSEISLFMEELKKLEAISEIKQMHIGTPAPIIRSTVDRTYSIALTVFFLDIKGHDTYQVHPLHKEFLERNRSKWNRVQIYDINV